MAASTSLNRQQRILRAKAAANTRWSTPGARTHQADRRLQWFANEVDPDHQLPEAERLELAKQRRRAYMQGLALLASKARSRTGGGLDAA